MGLLGSIGCGIAGPVQSLITSILEAVIGGAASTAMTGDISAVLLVLVLVFIVWRLTKSHIGLVLIIFVIPFLAC